jgi:hypothetical protein
VTSPENPAAHRSAGRAVRWYQRVLPVVGLAVLLVGVVALVVPSVRHQAELSLSRQPEPYVELYFARTGSQAAPQAVCTRSGDKVRVHFVIGSHLEKEQPVAYRVTVDPASKGARTLRKAGSATTVPDVSTTVDSSFALARSQGYTVSVSLPAFDQQLRAHCSGRRS